MRTLATLSHNLVLDRAGTRRSRPRVALHTPVLADSPPVLRAITNVYRASRGLFLAQRFARHASPLTTIIYAHVSE